MSESNGKWQIGFWVITVLVVASFSWSTFCAYSNQRKIEDLFDKHWELKEVANEALHRIDMRLTRMEDKMGLTIPYDPKIILKLKEKQK